jgi:hypothetical protein
MKCAFALCFLLTIIQSGCPTDEKKEEPPKKVAQAPHPQTPTHRFVLTRDIDLAFDTQTGQLCRTWDWQPVAPQTKPTAEGLMPQRKPGEYTPTCLTLYQQNPTIANNADPLGLLDENEKPN